MTRIFHVREDLLRELVMLATGYDQVLMSRPSNEVIEEIQQVLDVGPPDEGSPVNGGTLERLDGKLTLLLRNLDLLARESGDVAGKLMRRLGGEPKQGFGYATLDSLDEKLSTLFVGLEKMGMPPSWVTKQRKCPATWSTAFSGGQCDLGYGHGGEFHLDRANQRVWDDQGVQFQRAR